jgi:chloramphenicol O-acetyltransferase
VIKDYQRFKQLEREKREEQKEELAKLAKKFSITCRTNVSIPIIYFKEISIIVFVVIKFFLME